MNKNNKSTVENVNIVADVGDVDIVEDVVEEKQVEENINPNDQLKKLLRYYIAHIEAENVMKKEAENPENAAVKRNKYVYPEFEVRFGTRGPNRISKIDYDNVKKVLETLLAFDSQ
jgi:hypothetical protein